MVKQNNIPTICICGRPNVGKSSLFNCLVGERRAVVVEESGTTRDRVELSSIIGTVKVKLVDTGGYLSGDKDQISMQVKGQVEVSMKEADLILLVTDTLSGISPFDEEISKILRKSSKPVILVANKADNEKLDSHVMEFFSLGFGEPQVVACLHRKGINALKERIEKKMKEILGDSCEEHDEDAELNKYFKIAIVGRPNVGKSSFVNSILDQNRVIVSDTPGTTRDSIDTHFCFKGEDFLIIDTAGMRHDRKIKTVVDVYSIMRSKEAIERSDSVFLLLDACDGVTRDDIRILDFIAEKGKACLILVNKWDLAAETEGVSKDEYKKHLLYAHNELSKFPIEFISAKSGDNVIESLDILKGLDQKLDSVIPTRKLNKIFEQRDPSKVPVPRSSKRPNFFYIVQVGTRPLVFRYFVNDPEAVTHSHISFIENRLREKLPLEGVPIKIMIAKSRKDPK